MIIRANDRSWPAGLLRVHGRHHAATAFKSLPPERSLWPAATPRPTRHDESDVGRLICEVAGALLAVSGTRQPLIPAVPSFEEPGFGACGASRFYGLAALTGTPEVVRAQIAKAFASRLADATFQREQLSIYGFDAVGSSPAEFASALTGMRAQAGARVKAAGMMAE